MRDDEFVTAGVSEVNRLTYVVDKAIVDRDEAVTACTEVLELLRPRIRTATVDAYTDYRDELPTQAAAAERWLFDRGRARGHGDPGMGVDLDLSDPQHWAILRLYAPWSICVELKDEVGSELGGFDDCGYSISAELTSAEALKLQVALGGVPVLPLAEVHAHWRAERAARRRQRHKALRALLRFR